MTMQNLLSDFRIFIHTAEHNCVIKLLKESCQKSLTLVRKVTFSKTLNKVYLGYSFTRRQRWLYIDYMSLFWDMLHF